MNTFSKIQNIFITILIPVVIFTIVSIGMAFNPYIIKSQFQKGYQSGSQEASVSCLNQIKSLATNGTSFSIQAEGVQYKIVPAEEIK